MEPYIYDLSRNMDMKQTCFVTQTKLNNEITSKKTSIYTTERNEGPVHNNKMNVKNEERGTRSNQRGHRSRSKGKHKRLDSH